MERINILIVDDHTVAREGLRAMLETEPSMNIVGEASDGDEAVEKIVELEPRIVLMDIRMPRVDGLEATRQIKTIRPTTAVIIITSYDDEALIVNAVQAGAAGYLLKDASRDLLINTIATVASGGTSINAKLLRRALGNLEPGSLPVSSLANPQESYEELSARESDVLKLLAEGWTNKEIADHLCLAEVTVKKHVQSIIAKLRASDRTHAAIKALRIGLLN